MADIRPFNDILPRIHPDAWVAPTAVIIGDVEIGAFSSVWDYSVLRGDVAPIRVGERSNIQDGTVVHVASEELAGRPIPTLIGDDITIGHMVLLHACTLEDGCFIGMRSVIMDEAHIEAQAMVGAAALIPPRKRVGAKSLWLGSPARYVQDLSADQLAMNRKNTEHYLALAQAHAR